MSLPRWFEIFHLYLRKHSTYAYYSFLFQTITSHKVLLGRFVLISQPLELCALQIPFFHLALRHCSILRSLTFKSWEWSIDISFLSEITWKFKCILLKINTHFSESETPFWKMVIYYAWCSWWIWPEDGHSPWRGTHGGTGGQGPTLVQCVPEGWAPWYGANLKQLLNSCNLFKTHVESVLEGWH